MTGSLAGRVFSLAVEQPTLFNSAAILYPKKLLALIGDEEEDEGKKSLHVAFLETMEDIATRNSWKVGFNDVMYRETTFSGLEAPYNAMKSSTWYQDLSKEHKAALADYDLFKDLCRNGGHTFLTQKDTKNMSGLEFLIKNNVVKRQVVEGDQERFHLMKYWIASARV